MRLKKAHVTLLKREKYVVGFQRRINDARAAGGGGYCILVDGAVDTPVKPPILSC